MNAEILEVEYDPELKNWDTVIENELKRRNLSHWQIKAIMAYPIGLKAILKNRDRRNNGFKRTSKRNRN
jgi:hypothetical protein